VPRFQPPLTVSREQLQAAVDGLQESLDAVAQSRHLLKRGEFDTVFIGRGVHRLE
jgi:hypothetical protein